MSEIKFSQDEWERATDLAVRLLTALGEQPQHGCEVCNPPRLIAPNYDMKCELAKALRELQDAGMA